jgi:hypothetical protein
MHPKLLESTVAQCRAYIEAGDGHGEALPVERLIAAVAQLADDAERSNLAQERNKARRQGFIEGMSAATHRNLVALLRRGLAQLDAWQRKYGEHQPAWLPPAGDVRWAEDVDRILSGTAVPQPLPSLTDDEIRAAWNRTQEPVAMVRELMGRQVRMLTTSEVDALAEQHLKAEMDTDIGSTEPHAWVEGEANFASAVLLKFCEVNGINLENPHGNR